MLLTLKIKTILLNLIPLLPDFIIVPTFWFFSLFLKSIKFKIQRKKSESKRDLIYLDIEGAIGDFTIYIRNLIYENSIGNKYDVLVHEKFRGILEKFHLSNINIIYKKYSTGSHYEIKNRKSLENILSEAREINTEYNNVYYLCTNIFLDQILFLSQIKYNKLIKMKEIYKNSHKKTFWGDLKHLNETFYTYSRKIRFKIKSKGNKHMQNIHFVDYAYYIMHNKLPEKSLLSINISNVFKASVTKNTVAVLLDQAKRSKFLKINHLIDFLNNNYKNYNVIFLGMNIDLQDIFPKDKFNFKVVDHTTKNNKVEYLYKEIAEVEEVLAFDTCIVHIAAILNKKIMLICNENEYIIKYRFNAWLSYYSLSDFKFLKLSSDNFYN